MNTFGYVEQSPLLFRDFNGLCPMCELGAAIVIGAAVYGIIHTPDIYYSPSSPYTTVENNNTDIPIWESDDETHPTHNEVESARNCKDNGDGDYCYQLGLSIDILVRDLKFRRWDMQRYASEYYYYDKSHVNAYNARKSDLVKLVMKAKQHGCLYNPEADIEITRKYNFNYSSKGY